MSLPVAADREEKPCYVSCMEFSYTIDAEDYARAWTLADKRARLALLDKIPILIAVILVASVVYLGVRKLGGDYGFLAGLLGVPVGTIAEIVRHRFRHRKDHQNCGDIQMHLHTQGIAVSAEGGATIYYSWSDFSDWRRDQDLIVLRLPSNAFQTIRTKTLSQSKRAELFETLRSSLPKG